MKDINYQNFTNSWWNNFTYPLPLGVEEWFKFSYLGDDSFWKEEVFDLQEQLLPFSQSYFGKSYDFYHDCICRHTQSNKIAFSIFKGDKHPKNWTYEEIHHCVNYHVEEWAHDQLKDGDLIAIVGAPNIHFILGLFTALRFGLKVCYLPTNSPFLGYGQIIKFLKEIKPKFMVSEDPSFVVDGAKQLNINEKSSDEENHKPLSFSYPASCEFQTAISLEQQEELRLVPIDAQKTYLNALRDALYTLNLLQCPNWASPLACPIRTEPCSTLMSFLSGATKVYVPDEAIKKNPLIIESERINIIGISNELQKLWNDGAGLPVRSLKYYYKNPIDTNYQAWKSFVQLNKIEKLPQFDLLMDSSLGGAVLFSRPSFESFNVFCKSALGTPWYLSEINGSGQESLKGFGIFEIEGHPSLGNYTATQNGNQLMLTGTVSPARLGVTFPIEQIEREIAKLSFVEDCMLHPVSKMGSCFSHYFVLLVFVNPLKEEILDSEKDQWTKEIEIQITNFYGSGYLPDKIEYFALIPKKHLLGLDRNWCTNQFNSGLLLKKREFSQYKFLGVLKKLIHQFTNQEVS